MRPALAESRTLADEVHTAGATPQLESSLAHGVRNLTGRDFKYLTTLQYLDAHCSAIAMALLGIKGVASRSLSTWLRPASRPTLNGDSLVVGLRGRAASSAVLHHSGEVR